MNGAATEELRLALEAWREAEDLSLAAAAEALRGFGLAQEALRRAHDEAAAALGPARAASLLARLNGGYWRRYEVAVGEPPDDLEAAAQTSIALAGGRLLTWTELTVVYQASRDRGRRALRLPANALLEKDAGRWASVLLERLTPPRPRTVLDLVRALNALSGLLLEAGAEARRAAKREVANETD